MFKKNSIIRCIIAVVIILPIAIYSCQHLLLRMHSFGSSRMTLDMTTKCLILYALDNGCMPDSKELFLESAFFQKDDYGNVLMQVFSGDLDEFYPNNNYDELERYGYPLTDNYILPIGYGYCLEDLKLTDGIVIDTKTGNEVFLVGDKTVIRNGSISKEWHYSQKILRKRSIFIYNAMLEHSK